LKWTALTALQKWKKPQKKTEGVTSATVNYMTQKIEVEFADGADEKSVMKSVLKACRKVEPDCEIDF